MKMFDFNTFPIKQRLITSVLYGFFVTLFSYIIYTVFDMADYGLRYYAFFFIGMSVIWFFLMPYSINAKK